MSQERFQQEVKLDMINEKMRYLRTLNIYLEDNLISFLLIRETVFKSLNLCLYSKSKSIHAQIQTFWVYQINLLLVTPFRKFT